ncbi:MAG: DUF1015 domain-containing protein [Pseudomonadota bacterium]|nr:MAG: DUF1015 domain-containing protein [Pseudomonadota bacterium]
MTLIRPFTGLRPIAGRAADVVAPPYDVLSSAEALERAAGKPWSFLHISKPEIDLEPGVDPYDERVYARGAANLRAMIEAGVLMRDPVPCYYVYRLIMGDHTQTGLVAEASVAEYDAGRIRRHEFTRPDKEEDRVRQIDALNAQTGPVFVTYRHDDVVDAMITEICNAEPAYDVTADDGVRHILWVESDPTRTAALTAVFERMDRLYIADGHHRSAAASRVATMRRAANPGHTGEESYNYFQTVIFPDNQMKILDYNRVVADLGGHTPAQFLDAVAQRFTVESENHAVRPDQHGEFGMYVAQQWYRLHLKSDLMPEDPVGRLDVSLLQDNLIAPVLGIEDPRRDKRIDFVGGIRGLDELERRVDSGDMSVAFALRPTGLDALMAVADAGEVMPPKSTWFEPKLADGLVSHVLD